MKCNMDARLVSPVMLWLPLSHSPYKGYSTTMNPIFLALSFPSSHAWSDPQAPDGRLGNKSSSMLGKLAFKQSYKILLIKTWHLCWSVDVSLQVDCKMFSKVDKFCSDIACTYMHMLYFALQECKGDSSYDWCYTVWCKLIFVMQDIAEAKEFLKNKGVDVGSD